MEVRDPQPITVTWHPDTTHTEAPPRVSLLLARRVPEFGGDTMFASQHAVVADVGLGERSLHRVTIEGEPPN